MFNFKPNNTTQKVNSLADFSSIKPPEMIPEGKYLALVLGWKADHNKNGTPLIRFTFEVVWGVHKGKKVYRNVYWTPASKVWARQFCDSIGIDPNNEVDSYPAIYVHITVVHQGGYVEVSDVQRVNDKEKGQLEADATSEESQTPEVKIPGML